MKVKVLSLALVASLISTVLFGSFAIDIHAIDGKPNNDIAEIDKIGDILKTVDIRTPKELAEDFEKVRQRAEEKARIEAEEKAKKEAEARARANMPIEKRIELACERYGVPYELVLAIARLETGWFKSSAYIYGNNPGGLSVNEVPIVFNSIDEGVDAFVKNLSRNYFSIGLDTPELIGKKYCPVNPEWAIMVRELMRYE